MLIATVIDMNTIIFCASYIRITCKIRVIEEELRVKRRETIQHDKLHDILNQNYTRNVFLYSSFVA